MTRILMESVSLGPSGLGTVTVGNGASWRRCEIQLGGKGELSRTCWKSSGFY